jgi:hypothetical protein
LQLRSATSAATSTENSAAVSRRQVYSPQFFSSFLFFFYFVTSTVLQNEQWRDPPLFTRSGSAGPAQNDWTRFGPAKKKSFQEFVIFSVYFFY